MLFTILLFPVRCMNVTFCVALVHNMCLGLVAWDVKRSFHEQTTSNICALLQNFGYGKNIQSCT